MKKKETCVYCNGAPTNHILHYIETSREIFVSDFLKRFTFSWPKSFEKFAMGILLSFNFIFEKLGLFRYDTQIDKAPDSRTKSILLEAQKRGIPFGILSVLGKYTMVCRAYVKPRGFKKAKWFYFDSLPFPPQKKEVDITWIDDKLKFKKKFTEENLPVVKSFVVTKKEQAIDVFRHIGVPVIVKPRSGSRARHTTVNISNETDLIVAYNRAKQLCRYLLVEEYVVGSLYRATCIGGKLIGVVKFVKPAVIADGVKNMRELLEYHNANKKYPNLTDVQRDAWFFDAISHQGYAPESIPEKGKEILLSEHSERPNGGYFVDVTDEIPKETVEVIERATQVLDLDVVGFDIISKDLTKPASVEKFFFIEANTLPFIELHLVLYEGKVRDTPKALWDLWF